MVLETAPSFSLYNSGGDENVVKLDESLQRSVTIGDNVDLEFSFRVTEEDKFERTKDNDPALYLPTVAEIENTVFKQSQVNENADFDRCHPSHPMYLRSYAQLLLSKSDLLGAEEWYSQAILADPGDGELLAVYAKLIWEVHRDQEKAASYFERAVEAAPQNSHVLAAYASFLWDSTADDKDQGSHLQNNTMALPVSPV